MDAEDHVVLTDTYPAHSLSKNKPDVKTCTELTAFRKKIEKEDIRGKKEKRDS